jgi:hypothetical protein
MNDLLNDSLQIFNIVLLQKYIDRKKIDSILDEKVLMEFHLQYQTAVVARWFINPSSALSNFAL